MTVPLPFQPTTPDVLIVFDRSGSMNGAFGMAGGTRYSVEAMVLKGVLATYETRVRFGYAQFPSKGACPGGASTGCCADRPSVDVGFMNAAAISAAIDGAAAVSGPTPTSEALRFAREYYEGLVDGIKARYVLLSTDGQPTCDIAGASSQPPFSGGAMATWKGCEDAKAEAAKLAAIGVKVISLGIAIGEAGIFGMMQPDCIEGIALMGGAPRPGGPPSYYDAKDPATLSAALDSILGAVVKPSCLIELKSLPPDPSKVAVFFDGKQVPWDPTHTDGWDYEPGSMDKIRVYGTSCMNLEAFKVMAVDIRFGCPPCTGTLCP